MKADVLRLRAARDRAIPVFKFAGATAGFFQVHPGDLS